MPLALNVIQKKVPCSEEKSSVIWAEQLGRNKRLVLTLMTVENKQKKQDSILQLHISSFQCVSRPS